MQPIFAWRRYGRGRTLCPGICLDWRWLWRERSSICWFVLFIAAGESRPRCRTVCSERNGQFCLADDQFKWVTRTTVWALCWRDCRWRSSVRGIGHYSQSSSPWSSQFQHTAWTSNGRSPRRNPHSPWSLCDPGYSVLKVRPTHSSF